MKDNNRKAMWAKRNSKPAQWNNWKSLQERGRNTNHFNGYKIIEQKQSSSTGKRPDYFGYLRTNPRQRIVGDAKNVKELTKQNVDQVKHYKSHPFYAQKGVIIVKKTTKVPIQIREYAKNSNITITKIHAKRTPKEKGILDWLGL